MLSGPGDERGSQIKTIVEPPRRWRALDPREIWNYRELLYFLAWRDVKVRYKQTAIGIVWVILQPFLAMIVFSIIFGKLMGISSDGVPYAVFAYTALLPWNFFSGALTRSGNSLINDSNLISKVYFPRLVLPFSAVLSLLLDFAISFVILLGMIVFYGLALDIKIFLLPIFLLLAFMTALGIGLWLSALNIKYRDFAHIIPFLAQFWLFITPVAYSSKTIPQPWQMFYSLNPMVGVVEGFRWVLLGQQNLSWSSMFLSFIVVLALFIVGIFYFHSMEVEFADVV